MGYNKNKAQSPPRSISSAGSSSAVSKTGMQQQEAKASSAKESTAQLTVEPSLGRKGGTISSVPIGNNKNKAQSPPRSISSAGSASAVSKTGLQQKEAKASSAKESTTQLSPIPSNRE